MAHQPDSWLKDEVSECYMDQSNLIGTWQLAAACNWARGDRCSRIPESERRNAFEFYEDGTCLRWVDDTTAFELEYQVVFGDNRLTHGESCLLTIGGAGNRQTWAIRFRGSDTLSMSLMAYDAGSATHVRAF